MRAARTLSIGTPRATAMRRAEALPRNRQSPAAPAAPSDMPSMVGEPFNAPTTRSAKATSSRATLVMITSRSSAVGEGDRPSLPAADLVRDHVPRGPATLLHRLFGETADGPDMGVGRIRWVGPVEVEPHTRIELELVGQLDDVITGEVWRRRRGLGQEQRVDHCPGVVV